MGVLQQTPTPHRHRSCYQSITERGLCRTHHSTLLSTAKMKHLLLVSLVTLASLPSLLALPQTSAQCRDGAAESFHVEVYSVPWRGTKEIIWDATTCTRPQ